MLPRIIAVATLALFVMLALAGCAGTLEKVSFTVDAISLATDPRAKQLLDNINQTMKKIEQDDYKGSVDPAEKNLELAKQIGQPRFIAMCYGLLSSIYQYLDDYPRALAYSEQFLAIAKEMGDRKYQASALGGIANVYGAWRNYPKELSFYEQALVIYREIGDREHQVSLIHDIGIVYYHLGKKSEALSHFDQSLKMAKELGNHSVEEGALANIGLVYYSQGDYPKALYYFDQSSKVSKNIESRNVVQKIVDTVYRKRQGVRLNNIGSIYRGLGDYSKALSYYEQSLQISQELGGRSDEANALSNIGLVHQDLNDYAKALPYYQKALAKKKEIGVPATETKSCIGNLYLEQGNLDKAHSTFNEIEDPSTRSATLGRYYLFAKDYQNARKHFGEILPKVEKQGTGANLEAVYIGLGLSSEGLKDFTSAREYYLKAVKLMEEQRETLSADQRRHFFSGKAGWFKRIEPYEGLIRVSIHLKDHESALYWAENTKARLLLEAMAKRAAGERLGISAELSQKEADLSSRLGATQKQMDQTVVKNPGRHRELEAEMQGLKQERQSLIARIKSEFPEYASIHYPAPVHAKEFKLQPQEALIEYAVTNNETFGWLVRGGKVVKTVTIPVTKKDLRGLANKYRGFFEGINNPGQLSRFDPKVGKALYDLLVKGLAADLKPGEPVIIIPDGILGIIPFEALVPSLPAHLETSTGQHGPYPTGLKYFGDEHPVTIYQSGTALAVVRTLKKSGAGATDKMLVLADPDFGSATAAQGTADTYKRSVLRAVNRNGNFASLPSTRRLAEKFKAANGPAVDVLLGANASEQELKSKPLNQYRYQIYATHGILDNEIPYVKEPALVLSQREANPEVNPLDGFLTMTKVMDLKLNADLVALTACNTGVGKDLTGEGVMGMGRAFQYAGSKSVLMSLWSVEDESTNLLTEKYFNHLKGGKDRLEALRLARLDLRQAGYEHPFYWGAFILVGER